MKHFSNEFCQMQNFTLEKASVIREQLSNHFKSKDFVLISNRDKEHTVSPEVYKQGQLDNMKGLAIVSHNVSERNRAINEQSLYKNSFVFFTNLDEAISWAETFF